MIYLISFQFDQSSGPSISKSKTIQTNSTYCPLKQKKIQKTTSEELSISDEEGETKLFDDRYDISKIKQSTRITILDILKVLYAEKVTPDYLIFMESICKNASAYNDLGATNLKSLVSIMTGLGFIEKKSICGKTIVVERADQRFERYTYFTKMKTARIIRNRPIVYIDERIIDSKLGFEKVHSHNMNSLPEDSTIFYHALTRDGLLNGIFSNQATEKEFTKWVSTILMSYLKAPSLVIMDRGPLHGVLEDLNPITRYSPKAKMLKWLIDNNIPFNEHMARPVLYELIRKYRTTNKEYKIDKILKAHGHKVLRLPYTFPDLNLSHLFWFTVSEGVQYLTKSYTNLTQQIIQDKIRETILSMSKNKRKYELEKLLMLKENEIYLIDIAIENKLVNYVFKEE